MRRTYRYFILSCNEMCNLVIRQKHCWKTFVYDVHKLRLRHVIAQLKTLYSLIHTLESKIITA